MENNEILVTEELNEIEAVEGYDETEVSGGGLGKILIGAGVVAVAGIAALVYKNKAKLEERRIERMRKKGYVIYKADECEVREFEDGVDVEEDETIE